MATERTNVTDTGYTYNGQNFKNETRTDSQGNNYTVAIPTAISSSSLNPVQQVQLPPPVAPVVPNSTNALGYIQSTSDNATRDYEANLEQSRALAEKQTQAEQLLGLRESDTQKAYQEGGVTNLAGELRKLSAQSQALQADSLAKTLAEQNKATGQNITAQAVQRNTADVTRENVINQAGIAMKSAILKADFDTAKEMADTMINAKYSQLEADIKTKQRQQEIYDKYTLSPSERKMLEAVKKQTNLEEQKLAEKKANEKSIEKLLIEASPVAPPDVLSRAKEIQAKGGSPTEVAMALGRYGGDYMKNKLLDEQLKTEIAQRSKIYSDISVNKAQKSKIESEIGALTTTGIPTKPLTEGQAKDLTYAQRTDQASPKIETLGASIISMNPISFSTQMKLAESGLTSGQVSPEIRQYNQAVRNFITANLRRESGATINPSEFKDAFQVYIPFPGDDSTTLQAKKQARETAIASFKGNVPGYNARVATPESSYIDTALSAVNKVEAKTTPINAYTSRLIGLPGIK